MGKRIAIVAMVGFAVLALIIAVVYASFKPNHVVAMGTPIQQDDFIYVVTGVGRTQTISNHNASAKAKGTFYIVTIRVDNDAKRANFKWDRHIPYIMDAGGARYDVTTPAQAALDAGTTSQLTIGPGQSASYQAVFDVPNDIKKPVLALNNGILMGDIFNFAEYRRIGVALY